MKLNPATHLGSNRSGDRLTRKHRIRILLADDNQQLRTALKRILESEAEYEVVGEACNGFEAVRMTQVCRPDVVIMDISMPQKNGLIATAELTHDFPKVRVMIWSSHTDSPYVELAIRAGAVGYLVKSGQARIEIAIRAVASGHTYFDPIIAQHVPAKFQGVN